jgi:hypothetical protein
MKKETKQFFWPSYVDVMTALFIIMLLLFILSFKSLQDEKTNLVVKLEQKKYIEKIEESLKNLPAEYYVYQEKFKRHTLRRQPRFERGSSDITNPENQKYLLGAGKSLLDLINKLKANDTLGVTYLVILEGMASNDDAPPDVNYNLSYRRALALYNLWTTNQLNFSTDYLELIFAGSGTGGIGRDPSKVANGVKDDSDNQKILIQIIPKLGQVK